MTSEVVLLIALWIVFGLIDAWVLHELGHSNWRWTVLCVVTGPLAISVLYDQMHALEPEHAEVDSAGETGEAELPHMIDEGQPIGDPVDDWPRDDPEGPFVLQGYRGLADH